MDNKDLVDLLLGNKQQGGQQNQKQDTDVSQKLEIINRKLDLLIAQAKPKKGDLFIGIVTRGYYVYNGKFKPRSSTLFAIPLPDGKSVVMMRDTLDLLHYYLRTYKKGDLEKNLPDRLLPVFEFLKQNGLIEETEDSYRLKIGLVI